MRLIDDGALGRVRIGRLATQFGIAFAIAMIAVGTIGFGMADHWVSSRIDASLRHHTAKYIADLDGAPDEDAQLTAKILEWQHRKVLSERTYVLFDREGNRLAGRLDIRPLPEGFSDARFTGGGHHMQIGRALATRLHSGGLFVAVQQSAVEASLHALLPMVVLGISAIALVLGVSATFLFAFLTAKRLSATQQTAAAIAGGDLSRRIPTDRLDGMFAVQANSLNRMLDHMEELVRTQQLFSSNLAHELRTPLTRMQGLLAKAARDDRPAAAMLVGRAERECASIIRIFDALLRLAEIETGQHGAAMEPFALRPLVEDLAETMEPVLADRGVALRVDHMDDAEILGDPDLINQLIINLLENVATHTPSGTQATLSLEAGDDGDATIIVCDDGPGLSGGEFARITQPFERGADASARSGSGLGLAIAKAIVRFHRGHLDLEDARPGLKVSVSLPQSRRPIISPLRTAVVPVARPQSAEPALQY
jgi:signal transduction histidine kinase